MKKWMIAVSIAILILFGTLACYLKIQSDIGSALASDYIVLFLDEDRRVDLSVAGDIDMFDDVVENAVDDGWEKDGISIHDAISRLGANEGSRKVKEIVIEKDVLVDHVVLTDDDIISLFYPSEKIEISGSVRIKMKRKDIISLFRGEIDSLKIPIESPHGIYYTSQINMTKEMLKAYPPMSFSFQIVLKDQESQKLFNVHIYGEDLEALCVMGVLGKTFTVEYCPKSIEECLRKEDFVKVTIPATITLEDVGRYAVNDTVTINQPKNYRIVIDSKR